MKGMVSKSAFSAIRICCPPLALQRRFAAIVESIELQKTRQRAHLAELDALFVSLQHRAFNGELKAS
jgi:type I restriction enzyme S subunit